MKIHRPPNIAFGGPLRLKNCYRVHREPPKTTGIDSMTQIDLQLTRFGETRPHFGEKSIQKHFCLKYAIFDENP